MSITIKINGLPVEFTDQKPTRPGAYYFAHDVESLPLLRDIELREGEFISWYGGSRESLGEMLGLWAGPLFPGAEIVKAYHEGYGDSVLEFTPESRWQTSNARKVVDGLP